MLLPFLGWAVTGLVFFIKPGYEGAYEILTVKTYPLDGSRPITPDPEWLEFRYFKTALGYHLIARTDKGWLHLDPGSMQRREAPTEEEIRALLTDAFSLNPARYGGISSISKNVATTDSGIEITLDWNRLTLQQRGKDTDRIDLLYRIHYLQWTGVKSVDRIVGLAGLTLVLALTLIGARLAFK